MAKVEYHQAYPERSASECFNTCLTLIDEIGYTLFKKREIANLIICNGMVDNKKVDLSIVIPMTDPTSISVNLSADQVDEEQLKNESDRIFNVIDKHLSH